MRENLQIERMLAGFLFRFKKPKEREEEYELL